MQFGLFFELSVPRPFTGDAERRVFDNALEQARLADELGFDSVWAVEHHFLEEYSHSSAPELFLTACAMRTTRIRLGHGAVVCVPQMNHPVRVAERAAVLDILSGGRLEFGTARSSTWTELGGFQVDPDTTKKTWDEYVRVLPKMWMQERFAYEGVSFAMPERAIIPKPLQKPHPPLWVTVTSPGTELDAADRGIGCLGVAAASYAEQERRTIEYRRRIKLCDPVGAVNERVATLNFLYCHENPTQAATTGLLMLGMFGVLNTHLLSTREAYPTRAYHSLGNLAPRPPGDDGSPGDRRAVPEGITIGDPEQIIAAVKRWESIGVDSINFIVNAVEMIPQQDVLDSLRLFAREVMPRFRTSRVAGCASSAAAGLSISDDPHATCDEPHAASAMLIGTANIDELAARAPVMERLDSEPVTCEQADVLQVTYEIATPHRAAMLPPALHPTDPPLVTWLVYRCPASPWGRFAMAQTRIQCRSGLRLRAFLVSAVVDNADAAAALATRWGFTVQDGQIELHRHYDSARAVVTADGRSIFDVIVADPDPLSAADVQYAANMNLAHTPRGLRLVQVEPRYQIHRVERGRPRVQEFEGPAWGDARVQPVYPVSASLAVADVTFPRVRFVCRPDVLAFDGTEAAG